MKNLDKYCKQNISSLILDVEELHLGDYIASYYTGSRQWHRAVVVEIEHHNSISIRYIDYGTLEKNVKIDRIVRLDPLFYDLPKQAIRVKSANIWPLNSSKNSIIEAGEYMYGLVVQKELIGKLISFSSERVAEIILIDISLNKSTEVLFVNEFLLKRGVVSDKPPKNDAKPTIKKTTLGTSWWLLPRYLIYFLSGRIYRSLIRNNNITSFKKYPSDALVVPVTMFLLKDVPQMITIFGEPDSGYITKIIKKCPG
ncbi:AKAP1 [Lepeophtheirus salmonis]|uniref:AKAP1 n=1 Tax=Lepeophtheirus salmonis TaxID=72036 RepID=A0A7R8CYA0_LEPSM|nr:AKAP1 [Lepeophtheirus salmonis]CAF2968160.1 AKAP1 [Lepeophtheirus salmonis]